ncbi:HEAT repeat domain-containing protein [Amycolatopsis sp. OK19-0408]|uniref:HEAT repeat domain-containing protein n=1 Tax=Amycolatopsis iheyensis TaxID=2945988 RepID=A0A9X2SJE8_9PSEU|nr:HEAT repeat domain-containing protein [Amycolatopsis iheyensis]MCR6482771.1 HEAT repeat domain-containing protein [Amycolatopsis iheyensis]
MYDELRALRGKADAARRKAGLRPLSQDETERILCKAPYLVADFRGQRLSDWLAEDFSKTKTPSANSLAAVFALARVWSEEAGVTAPAERYWADLLEAAQPDRTAKSRARTEPEPAGGPAHSLIDDYIAAAVRAAREHPYPGVLPGNTPPLTEVYVRQRVRAGAARSRPAGPGKLAGPVSGLVGEGASWTSMPPPRRVSGRMSAEEILDSDRICVVVGTPGGGKTSLFRTHLIRAVEARKAGELETSLPILVSAAALSGKPLAAALAEAVTAELGSFGLLEKLPDDLFKECPYEDVPWLVMVDGLDEITDTASRRNLLAALDQISDGSRGRQYRFVIATRPLPEWELAVLGAQAPVYELEPFTWSDLNRVSADWFRVLGLENPDRVAERFASAVRRTRVFGLARTPLMAALLCQLHGANPDAPLPASRGEIYRKYVEQLTRRMQSADMSGIQAQVRAGLERYGDEALGEGWRTLERLPELISWSAAEMHGGCSASILDIFSGLPGAACPKRVPAGVWREYLQSLLLRSGLIILRSGELSFFHQTVGEFLAATHATRSASASLESLATLFGRKRRVPLVERILTRRVTPPPEVDTSFTGFVLDQCGEVQDAVAGCLLRLVDRGGLAGCGFIAVLLRLGTNVPRSVVLAMARKLMDLVWVLGSTLNSAPPRRARGVVRTDQEQFENAFLALRLLASIGAEDALDRLRSIARDDDLHPAVRARAAEAVVDLDVDVAVAVGLLDELARNKSIGSRMRATLAARVESLDPDHVSRLLVDLARDTTLAGRERVASVMTLRGLEAALASELFAELALDTRMSGYSRVWSAGVLAGAGEARGIELLDRLARAIDVPIYVREEAVRALVKHGGSKADSVLSRLASDHSVDPHVGIRAGGALAERGDKDALKELERIAMQRMSDHNLRIGAVEMLAAMGEYNPMDLLESLVRDTTLDNNGRLRVLEIMLEAGGRRGVDAVKTLVDDRSLGDRARVFAAGLQGSIDKPTAVRLLLGFIGDRSVAGGARADAAELLAQLLLGESVRLSDAVDVRMHTAEDFRVDPVGNMDLDRVTIIDLIDDLSRDRRVSRADRGRAFNVLRRFYLWRR